MSDFDTDTMSGLMSQILAITAPPGTRDMKNGVQNTYNGPSNTLMCGSQTETSGLAAHPYFRRPGKGHNHDSCDACSEGGDLICCDICPASFHLTCHDPPLDEDNIPVGEWICHQCRNKKHNENIGNSNNRNGKIVKPIKKKENVDENEEKIVWSSGRQMEVSDSPFNTLVKIAASANPIQFSLPFEFTVPANFPNEPKDICKRNGRRTWGKKKPYELDNGLTPRPAILCFQCNKSCRIGPIIPCDYCNLFYHLDCVNPPLTIPPTGKWMCPSHPEHLVDSNLDSHSLIDRVKAWEKFHGPTDEHSIKLNFIKKCNRERANVKFKIKKITRSRIQVPLGVKSQYCNPPDLLPHLSSSTFVPMPPLIKKNHNNIPSLLDASKIISNIEDNQNTTNSFQKIKNEPTNGALPVSEIKPTEEERKEWLLSLLQFQSSMFKEISKDCIGALDDKSDSVINLTNGSDVPQSEKIVVNGHLSLDSHNLTIKSKPHTQRLKNGSRKNLRKLPYQKNLNNVELLSETLTSLGDSLKKKIEHNANIKINGFDQSLLEVLAYERILSIVTPPKKKRKKLKMPQIQARALLCPLVPDIQLKLMAPVKKYSEEPIPMTFRILNIGKGCHNHVNLELYGNCNYLSSRHAAVIYDQYTGSYELLNYSENGTEVDGINLNCNFSDKTLSEAAAPPMLTQLKDIADTNRGVKKLPEEQIPPVMNSMPAMTVSTCGCLKTEQGDIDKEALKDKILAHGWEGTSLLHHGSFIKFGCLKFVFSIVETAVHGEWANDVISTYEKFLVSKKDEPVDIPEEQNNALKS